MWYTPQIVDNLLSWYGVTYYCATLYNVTRMIVLLPHQYYARGGYRPPVCTITGSTFVAALRRRRYLPGLHQRHEKYPSNSLLHLSKANLESAEDLRTRTEFSFLRSW